MRREKIDIIGKSMNGGYNMIKKSRLNSKTKMILLILLFIVIDQSIKIYITNYLMGGNFNILGQIIEFQPKLNTAYSWFNSLGNFGVGLLPHIIINIIILFFSFIILDFVLAKKKENKIANWLFIFLIAGTICSLIDRMFWGGSLDYIYLKGYFIFDLKDVYISIFEVILVLLWVFNYKELRKLDEKLLYGEFKTHIKEKYFKRLI